MARPRRPRRRNKFDRLVNPHSSKQEIECDMAVAPMDRLARKMDEKWGIDRLPELVSVKTVTLYGSALGRLNAALQSEDPKEVAHRAQVVMRGLAAMDREAEAAGHKPASGDYWEADIDGFHFAVLKDGLEWPTVKADRPELRTFTMREVGLALKAQYGGPLVDRVKQNFEGAEIVKIHEKPLGRKEDLEDEIPF